jgi:DivIVA domain-containing protein
MGPDSSLTPELIQAQSFSAGFRGFDQAEVRSFLNRVASEIRYLRDHTEQLESAWHSAEERAARPPVLDEDTLMAAVGEETASILRSARAAASDLRSKAAEESEKALADAHSQADKIREDAKEALARDTLAAEEAATRLISAARSEGAEVLDKARIDADSVRAKAEQDRALTLEGANSTRDRILEDLSRRRRVATVQIEQLRAGRERLIESYAVVRRTLEEAQSELGRADAEARAAADEVGRRLRHEHDLESAEPNPISGDQPPGSGSVGPTTGPASPGPSAGSSGGGSSGPVVESARTVIVVGDLESGSSEAPGPSVTVIDDQEASPSGKSRPARRRAHIGRGRVEGSTVKADPAVDPSVEAEGAEGEAGETPTSTQAGSSVDELFARIRSTQPDQTASDPDFAPDAPTAPAPDASPSAEALAEAPASEDAGADEAVDERPVTDVDEALLQRRESAVVDLEVTLTRKLKRALQDEQNDLLDRLRGLRGDPTPARLLPKLDVQVNRYTSAARPLVEKAADAGVTFAGETLGQPGSSAGAPSVADLAGEAGRTIVDSLRRRLEQAINVSTSDEDPSVLVESLGAAYREWKSQRIERIAGDVLAAAFSRGTWHATPEGVSMRWVVDDADGPCPDCDDDALAGALPKGEVFPTGQHHPPAHSGCRCLLVPVSS